MTGKKFLLGVVIPTLTGGAAIIGAIQTGICLSEGRFLYALPGLALVPACLALTGLCIVMADR